VAGRGGPPLKRRSSLGNAIEGLARGARARALGLLYRGNRRECPVCGGRFRGFLPFGLVRRQDARCPGCGSLERHRLLWLYLERQTDLFAARRRVLHVAPEPLIGQRLASLPNLRYVSIDLDSPRAMVRMDATRLGFRDGVFDVILCFHVLEHVPDDRAAMGELHRTLKPDGIAILQTPFDPARTNTYEDGSIRSPAARERAFGQRDHVRIYGQDYEQRLIDAGFAVESVDVARRLPDGGQRHGLDPEERLTVCRHDRA
jgi:SAM-dependent methyltransferase